MFTNLAQLSLGTDARTSLSYLCTSESGRGSRVDRPSSAKKTKGERCGGWGDATYYIADVPGDLFSSNDIGCRRGKLKGLYTQMRRVIRRNMMMIMKKKKKKKRERERESERERE